MTLWRQEWKFHLKGFLIWFFVIVGMSFGCILLYSSVESSLTEMGDVFSKMGVMSTAFGMDRLSVATMSGYFATEIAVLHALGAASFAAILGSNLLAKEEFGHTIEFLAVLPVSRTQILIQKYLCMVSQLVCFQVFGMLCYAAGFVIMGEKLPAGDLVIMGLTQFLMMLEIGSVCFCISAYSRKNRMAVGIGVSMLLFAADMMARVVPAIEDLKYFTPYNYCNATDIFTDVKPSAVCFVIAGIVICVSVTLSFVQYLKKDLQ